MSSNPEMLIFGWALIAAFAWGYWWCVVRPKHALPPPSTRPCGDITIHHMLATELDKQSTNLKRLREELKALKAELDDLQGAGK